MAAIPLSWDDAMFSGVTNSASITVKDGGIVSNKSITDSGNIASILGEGSFTLDHVRINSREGVRIGGDGNIVINNSYIETTGVGADHADGIQAYSPGSSGNLTITNSTIASHNTAANAGLFIADNYGGSVTLNNVVFEGGPIGLRLAADNQDITVALKDVYFVGPFMFEPLLIQEVNANIHITQWENVRYATIVNGQLVPGALISSPFPVEGGGTPTPPPVEDLVAPDISSWSPDSGKTGDGVTNADKITLKGTSAAGSTVKVLDGNKLVGTVNADANGNWSFTSGSLPDGSHKFSAIATNSTSTSPASATRTVLIDTAAPVAPTIAVSTSAAALAASHVAVLTGNAEANSTVKVFDGATQIGTATVSSSGAWTFTTGNLATGSHSFVARAMDVAGNTGNASAAVPVTISTPTTPKPDAPTVTSFSNDSGTKGDGITNDNTITLTGTAAANSTVKISDGSTQMGSVKADSSGSWSYITSVLTDAKHMLTATATDSSGQTSAASSAVTITVDTKAPGAPTIATVGSASARTAASAQSTSVANGTTVNLNGTAEAKSTVAIYEGSTKIGSVTAGTDGGWSFSTGSLSAGQHTLTAKATDIAGNVGANSAPVTVSVTAPAPLPPSAPKIASFSYDTGKVGDGITSDNTLKLDGTAAGNVQVTIYDGTQKLGTVMSDGSGAWSFTTGAVSDGSHNLTARATDGAGQTGAASAVTKIMVDTHAPNAPTLGVFSSDGKALSGSTMVDDFLLKGTAEANSLVKLYDAGKLIGSATATSDGKWSFDTGHLSSGDHKYAAIASDLAGNASAASATKAISVIDPPTSSAGIDLTNVYQGANNLIVMKGTADAYSQIKIFDASKEIGTVKANADGNWYFNTGTVSPSYVHTFSAKELDNSGHVVSTSGNAVLGTYGANTLKGTSGDDIFIGNGHPDTFVFAPNFGNDTIKDFQASGPAHDVVQFSKSMFDNFADILSHATQNAHDVVITSGHDTLTLKNTQLGALDKSDFHFA
ncbi:MAG TPA: Ig-like domain-containing protein [Tardiphaga sp.]